MKSRHFEDVVFGLWATLTDSFQHFLTFYRPKRIRNNSQMDRQWESSLAAGEIFMKERRMFTINPPLSPNSPTYVGHFSPTERHTDKQLERRCYKLMRWHMLDLDERHRLHLHSDPNSNVNTREADFSCWASLCCTAVTGCDFFHSETKSKNTCGGNNVCRLEGRGCTAATAPPLPRTDLQVSTIHWERLAASSWDEATLEVRAGHTHTHTQFPQLYNLMSETLNYLLKEIYLK